ncbi:hypothetical protein J6590_045003, partial [Homalodisca vitripennis]
EKVNKEGMCGEVLARGRSEGDGPAGIQVISGLSTAVRRGPLGPCSCGYVEWIARPHQHPHSHVTQTPSPSPSPSPSSLQKHISVVEKINFVLKHILVSPRCEKGQHL